MKVKLSLIQTFFHVAHEGSFSAAARDLNISYQSVSNHIRRLETDLGYRLVKSKKGIKRIELTDQGLAIYNLIRPELQSMLDRLSAVLTAERPLLRVGLPSAIFIYLFPKVLLRLRDRFPNMEIQTIERDTMLPDLIMGGKLDVSVGEVFFGNPAVPQRVIGGYRLSLIYPKGWPAPPSPEDVPAWAKDKPFVTYEPGQVVRNIATDFLMTAGEEPKVAVSTSGVRSVLQCVNNGLGFSIIPSWCIDPGTTNLETMVMDNIPKVMIYFGHSQYLSHSPYIKELFLACQDLITPRLT